MARHTFAHAAALTAVVFALAAPTLAEAGGYHRYYEDVCTDRIHDNGVTGALLGGAAGALIGSNLAGHSARTGGALLGGAAGAVVGSNIARSSTKDRCRGPRRVVYYDAPPPRPIYVAPPPPPPVYVAPTPVYYAPPPPPPPVYGYEVYDYGPHDHGRHLGWYKHHHHDDDDD